MAGKTVLCVGRLLIDVLVTGANSHPRRYTPVEVGEISLSPGGSAYFTGKALAACGLEPQLISATGSDLTGQYLRSMLTDSKLDMREAIIREHSATSASVVTVNRYGDANYYLFRGADHEISEKLRSIECRSFDAIHFGNIGQLLDGPTSQHLKTMLTSNRRRGGKKSIVSVDFDKALERNKQIWNICEHIDVIFGNQQEICASLDLTLNIAFKELHLEAIQRGFRGMLVVKLGELGCCLLNCGNSALSHVPGYRFSATKNENGAGDVFCGVYLASFLDDADHTKAAERANCASSKHVSGILDIHSENCCGLQELCDSTNSTRSPTFELPTDEGRLARSERWGLRDESMHDYLELIGQNIHLDSSSNVLDIGCGYGRFGEPISLKFGCKVVGLDFDEEAVGYFDGRSPLLSARKCNFTSDNLSESLGPNTDRFDLIWASSLAPELAASKLPDLIGQLVGHLSQDGVLCIRDEPIECARQATWYQFFPDSHHLVERLHPTLKTLIDAVNVNSDVCVTSVQLIREVDYLSPSEVKSRLLKRGHAVWRRAYDDREDTLNSHLQSLINACSKNGMIEFVRFRYLVMAKRVSSLSNVLGETDSSP